MAPVMPVMGRRRGHTERIERRRGRKLITAAVLVKLLKVCAKLIAKGGKLLKLLVVKAGSHAVCIVLALGFYLGEQCLALVAERNMRNPLVVFVRGADNKLFLCQLAHHFGKGRGAHIKKLRKLMGGNAVVLAEQ